MLTYIKQVIETLQVYQLTLLDGIHDEDYYFSLLKSLRVRLVTYQKLFLMANRTKPLPEYDFKFNPTIFHLIESLSHYYRLIKNLPEKLTISQIDQVLVITTLLIAVVDAILTPNLGVGRTPHPDASGVNEHKRRI